MKTAVMSLFALALMSQAAFAAEPVTLKFKAKLSYLKWSGKKWKADSMGSVKGTVTYDSDVTVPRGDYNANPSTLTLEEGGESFPVLTQDFSVDNSSLGSCIISIFTRHDCRRYYTQRHLVIDKAGLKKIAHAANGSMWHGDKLEQHVGALLDRAIDDADRDEFTFGTGEIRGLKKEKRRHRTSREDLRVDYENEKLELQIRFDDDAVEKD